MTEFMRKHKGRRAFLAVCTIPALILFSVFMLYPTLNIFIISMYKWGGYSQHREFVGLDNFVKLFSDAKFWQSFQNTVLLIVIVTIVTMAVFYIPNILSAVVIAAIFSAVYDPSRGLLNTLLSFFTGGTAGQVLWLGDQKVVIYSIAIAMIWQAVGYYMVMYTASMSSVPESMYEAASLEGAGRVRQFFSITIPLIWTNIRTTLTFFIISSINISFLLVRAMTSGGPDGSTEVFLSYMYKQAYTNSSYGYGMAIGVLVFLFSFALSGIINLVTRRDSVDL